MPGLVLTVSLLLVFSFLVRISLWIYCFFFRPLDLSCYKGGPGEHWALVTGGSGGIGYSFIEVLLQQGFSVVLTGRDEIKLKATLAQLSTKYPERRLEYVLSDATDLSKENFQGIVEHCKDKNLRILINNAGISHGQWKLHYLDHDNILECIKVNSAYPTLLTRHMLPIMGAGEQQDGKRLVIFVTSVTAVMFSSPFASVYGATKSHLRSLSQSLSEEYSDSSIRFLSANFGYVQTKMSKMKKCLFATEPREAVICCLRMHDRVDILPHFKDFQWHFLSGLHRLFLLDIFPGRWFIFVANFRKMFDRVRGRTNCAWEQQLGIKRGCS